MSQTPEQDYYWVITDAGAALEAAAHAAGLPVNLTHVAVGDGNGSVPEPDRKRTALVNEVLRREIDARRQDGDDPNIAWLSMVIPATEGGFWIREAGIYAAPLEEGGEPVLYAIGSHAPYYKAAKVLGQAVSHELEVPIIMSGEASVQIQVRDMGYASQSALTVVQVELARQKSVDDGYAARLTDVEAWQLAHAIATYEKLGMMKPDGDTISIKADGTISVAQGNHWLLGEFYFFRHPTLREGFEALDGGEIENGAEMYPEFWQYIQTSEGQLLCLGASEREALANHVYYTLADGTPITYNGIGGVPFYTIDMATGTIVMPDIRGMHLEAAGFASLNVGGAGIDAIREILGGTWSSRICIGQYYGALWDNDTNPVTAGAPSTGAGSGYFYRNLHFRASRVVPTGTATAPRRFGVLACAYMGRPAL